MIIKMQINFFSKENLRLYYYHLMTSFERQLIIIL